MKIISKQGTLKAFYYLMALDGINSFEEEKYCELGTELLGNEFDALREEIVLSCKEYLDSVSEDDDMYDVIQEGIDQAISSETTELTDGVTSRLLVWNMLGLAYCDDDFSNDENRMISHVVRVLQVDKSVYTEMKQLIITAASVRREQEQLETSNRPYSEIRPLVDEIEKRKENVVSAAKALIEDEILFYEPQVENKKENKVLETSKKIGDSVVEGSKKFGETVVSGSKKIGETVAPVAKDIGEKTAKGLKDTSVFVGEKAVKGASEIKQGANKLFSKVKDSLDKSAAVTLPTKYERIKKKLPTDMGLPKDAAAYGMVNDNTNALVVCFSVSEESSMKFDDSEGLIKELHGLMDENSGIIEVASGVSSNGGKYIYHILKHSTEPGEPSGNTYTLNLNIQIGESIQFVNASFVEIGTTGLRDATIYSLLPNDETVKIGFEGWSADPYDADYKNGFLMNLSEQKQYDKMFPTHPLSEIRRLAEYIVGMN